MKIIHLLVIFVYKLQWPENLANIVCFSFKSLQARKSSNFTGSMSMKTDLNSQVLCNLLLSIIVN